MKRQVSDVERAALRLIKCRARKYVYSVRAAEENAFHRMLFLEEAIEEDANARWHEITAVYPRATLFPIVKKAVRTAEREIGATCDDLDMAADDHVRSFFERFDIDEMLDDGDAQ